jgi:chemotaxis protein MotB
MATLARRQQSPFNVWPGYVDALSALLMVVIFLVLIFSVAQFLLSQILSGQENELAQLHERVAQLTAQLGLEVRHNKQLTANVSELTIMVSSLTDTRRELRARLEDQKQRSLKDKAEIEQQLLLIGSLNEDIDALRQVRQALEDQVGALSASLQASQSDLGELRDRSRALETHLADQQERTRLAQKEITQKKVRIQALSALVDEQQQALKKERRLSADARAQVALLNQNIAGLQGQLGEISRALDATETDNASQATEIKDLGKRLNIALAQRVNTLERYHSEFFGRLSGVLGDNPQVRIEGDRFVLQAELLFASGSAELGQAGQKHLIQLAKTLRAISKKIPKEINWILRIDGHTDRVPVTSGRYASNWELSTARAVSVVDFLARQGIAEDHMAAAGFSKFHPLDPADTPEAYRKNRRIEIKLTSR